ncbi:unnamed protein product, partial [marine sediment metagenome]
MITYGGIKGGRDKLVAVSALLEQMRLEHNKQGAIARKNPEFLKNGKWKEYSKKFRGKQRPLLLEQLGLKRQLRRAVVDDDVWLHLGPEEQMVIINTILEAKYEARSNPITEATATELDDLRKIKVN